MPLYVMDCYYRTSPSAPVELRDASQRFDNLFYNSDTGEV